MDQLKSYNETRKEAEQRVENAEWMSFAEDESMTSKMYFDNSDGRGWEEHEVPTLSFSGCKWFSALKAETIEDTQPRLINSREELAKIWLSRSKLESFLNFPLFERTVVNCFVRICVAANGQQKVYRVAEIVGVVETARIYNCGKTRTNKRLRLKHGIFEKVFPLKFIANMDFTESEFLKWREFCIQQNVQMPSSSLIEKKVCDIQKALNFEMDVNRIMAEINKLQNEVMKKIFLTNLRLSAMLRGYFELSQVLYQQIENLGSSIHTNGEEYAILKKSFARLKASVICSVVSENSDWIPYKSSECSSESDTEDVCNNKEQNNSVHLTASKLCFDNSGSSDWGEDEESTLSYGSSVSVTKELGETQPGLIKP